MAWTQPHTYVVGETVTAALLNADIRDNQNWLLRAAQAVVVYRSAALSVSSGTVTTVSYDTEAFDTDGFHDNATNPERLTVPSGLAGMYYVWGRGSFAANGTGNLRYLDLSTTAGRFVYPGPVYAPLNASHEVAMLVEGYGAFSDGQYAQLRCYQDSGGALNFLAGRQYAFGMVRLGPRYDAAIDAS